MIVLMQDTFEVIKNLNIEKTDFTSNQNQLKSD